MTTMSSSWSRIALCSVASLVLAIGVGCGGGDTGATIAVNSGGSSTDAGTGTLRVALTDAPTCGYDAVKVTVDRVRVHQSSTAADGDGGWSEVVMNPPRQVDLLKLTNGVLEELGQTPLPAGHYSQLRLLLAENPASAPWANAVTPTNGAETALKTPSAQQSGLKMNVDLTVGANQMIDLVLDFDACKSVVRAGNSGQYLLKPVVSVVPRYLSGVSGRVDAAIVSSSTTVSLQQNGTVIKSTVPMTSGDYLLLPVAPGIYDLVVASPGRTTEVVTGVTVTANIVTPVPMLAPPPSPISIASGSVKISPLPSIYDAVITAQQALSLGRPIEVESHPAASLTGAYSLELPLASPLVAPYTTGPLVFTGDAAAASKYLVIATPVGFAAKSTAVILQPGTVTLLDFTFP